jgi:GNAT superfamily N-acetyltransferase
MEKSNARRYILRHLTPEKLRRRPETVIRKGGTSVKVINLEGPHKDAFENLISRDVYGRIAEAGWFAFGAVWEEQNDDFAAGALVFSAETGSNGEEDLTAATIQWLYIAEDFRRKGIAEALMRELFRVLEDAGAEHLLCDIPMPEEYNELCAYLESWGFEVNLTDVYEAEITLKELSENPLFAEQPAPMGFLPPAKVSPIYFRKYMTSAKEKPYVLNSLETNADYYEKNISCVQMADGEVQGALLLKKRPSGNLDVLYLRGAEPAAVLNMIRFSVHAASGAYPPDTKVHIVCRMDATAAILDKLFPRLQPLLVRRAYYSVFEPADVQDEEEV